MEICFDNCFFFFFFFFLNHVEKFNSLHVYHQRPGFLCCLLLCFVYKLKALHMIVKAPASGRYGKQLTVTCFSFFPLL